MGPEDNPADDHEPTQEEWDDYEAGRPSQEAPKISDLCAIGSHYRCDDRGCPCECHGWKFM